MLRKNIGPDTRPIAPEILVGILVCVYTHRCHPSLRYDELAMRVYKCVLVLVSCLAIVGRCESPMIIDRKTRMSLLVCDGSFLTPLVDCTELYGHGNSLSAGPLVAIRPTIVVGGIPALMHQ